jgi:hypothetical protein
MATPIQFQDAIDPDLPIVEKLIEEEKKQSSSRSQRRNRIESGEAVPDPMAGTIPGPETTSSGEVSPQT